MSSAAKPVNQPDALRLLLDRILRGSDATLIAEGDAVRVLLDLAADCLSGRRIRVLPAGEVLPSRLVAAAPLAHVAGQAPGTPDDEVLGRSFQSLTVLDPACDRIVLLVSDAHALKLSALRFIQFAGRSAAHLQFVFCGTRALFGLLDTEEFAWLRTRMTAGLVLTLAAPIPADEEEEEDAPPVPPPIPDEPAAWAEEAVVPLSDARRPAASAGGHSWRLSLGALALLGLAGTAGLTFGLQGGGADQPAAGRQSASVVPSSTPPNAPAPGMPLAGDAPHADPAAALAAPSSEQPVTTGAAQGANPGSPSGVPAMPPSAKAPDPLITVWSPTKATRPENEPRSAELPPGLARTPNRTGAPTAPSRAAMAALDRRLRRLREARDEPTPPREDQGAPPEPAFGSWTAPVNPPTRYIGSYTTDANGVRLFRPEP